MVHDWKEERIQLLNGEDVERAHDVNKQKYFLAQQKLSRFQGYKAAEGKRVFYLPLLFLFW